MEQLENEKGQTFTHVDCVGQLPPELFVMCMERVTWQDLMSVMNVCWTWRRMFLKRSHDSYWTDLIRYDENQGTSEDNVRSDDAEQTPIAAGVRYIRSRAENCHGCCHARAVSGLFAAIPVLHTTLLPLCESCFFVYPNAVISAEKVVQWYGFDQLRALELSKQTSTEAHQTKLPLQSLDVNALQGMKPNNKRPKVVQRSPRKEYYHLMEADGKLAPYNEQELYPRFLLHIRPDRAGQLEE